MASGSVAFVVKDKDSGKLHVTQEALRLLRKIEEPVAVVAGCGKCRVGKSSLLTRMNRKLGYANYGFASAASMEPHTKGLWMSPRPITVRTPNGEDRCILFLDSEGTEAMDEESQYMNKILALSMMLSSVALYNEQAALEANSFDTLALVGDIGDSMRTHVRASTDDVAASAELSKIFPHLFIVLHDSDLEFKDGPQEYLEGLLQDSPAGSFSERLNPTRRKLRVMFPRGKRHLVALPIPAVGRDKMRSIAKLPDQQLNPEFVTEFDKLINKVCETAAPTQTGHMLAVLAQYLVHCMNSRAGPEIIYAYKNHQNVSCMMATELALGGLQERMQLLRMLGLKRLEENQERMLHDAMETYKGCAVGSPRVVQKCGAVLQLKVETQIKDLLFQKKLEATCREAAGAKAEAAEAKVEAAEAKAQAAEAKAQAAQTKADVEMAKDEAFAVFFGLVALVVVLLALVRSFG